MHTEYLYQKNQIVFAETLGFSAYPARVTQVNEQYGTYKIIFIGYKAYSLVTASMMEKFNYENIKRYEDFYRQHQDPKMRIIFKKIEIAKSEYNRSLIKGRKGKNRSKNRKRVKDKVVEVIEIISGQNQEDIQDKMLQARIKNIQEVIDVQQYIEMEEKNKGLINEQQSKESIQQSLKLLDKSKQNRIQQIKQILNKLSPLHQSQSQSLQPSLCELNQKQQKKFEIRQQTELMHSDIVSQTISPDLISPQSSSPSAGIQIMLFQNRQRKQITTQIQTVQKINKQQQVTKDNISNLHPLFDDHGQKNQYILEESSIDEDSIREINICEDVDINDIDCDLDQLQQQHDDYRAMIRSMNYRKQRLSVLSCKEIIQHLTKIIDFMLKQVEKARIFRKARMTIMKKKQYLLVILSLSHLALPHFINHSCLLKMIDFVTNLQASQPNIRRIFAIQNFSIRSKLNILYMHFKKASYSELSIALETFNQISFKFQRYKQLKLTIDF